jgi:hypothetical protein
MVAVAQFIPDDPREKDSVLAVLREHPELNGFISEVSEEARQTFPKVQIALDSRRYDEWDPLLHLMIEVTQPWSEYQRVVNHFIHKVGARPDYDREFILVMPTWVGPRSSRTA